MHIPKIHIKPPKIKWRAYLERKVILLASLVLATYVMEVYFHVHSSLVDKTHELAVGVFVEHCLWGIPFGD
jgi:hypothetical protein